MKLSDAIRLGSMLRPQAFGVFASADGTCAMGAAFEALGVDTNCTSDIALTIIAKEQWGMTDSQRTKCPACRWADGLLPETIVHLNDMHSWSREQIADWLDTLQPAEVTSREPATSEVTQ